MIISLNATFLSPQSPAPDTNGVWSVISGPGTLVITGTSPNQNVNTSGVTPGTYVLEYLINNSPCQAVAVEYTLVVEQSPYAGNNAFHIPCNDWENA